MPATGPHGSAPSQSPDRDLGSEDAVEKWAMPLGTLAGTRISLSYTVFFAAAILVAVVLTIAMRPGNVDLPRAAALGTAFWLSGWLAQMSVQFLLTRVLGLRMRRMNLGLLGVETLPRAWPASHSLMIAVATIVSLLLLGSFFRLVEGGFQMPALSPSGGDPWAAPSIGFATHDSIWRSAAWLCWVQAIFQMYPLPRTMGRQVFGSLAVLCGRKLEPEMRATIFRRCLAVVALMTLALAIFLMSSARQSATANWPLVVLLAVLLWISTRGSDVTQFVTVPPVQDHEPGIVATIRNAIRSREDRKRLQRAFDQERGEAVDAERLDDILNRLHRDGLESLSSEDRKILERVSENLRKERRADTDESAEGV